EGAVGETARRHHHRDRGVGRVLFRRGLSPAIPGQESGRLLRAGRHRRVLSDRGRRYGVIFRPLSAHAGRGKPFINHKWCKTWAVSVLRTAPVRAARVRFLPIVAVMAAAALSGCVQTTYPAAVAQRSDLDAMAYGPPAAAPVVVADNSGG